MGTNPDKRLGINSASSYNWRQLGYRYYSLSFYLNRIFGGKTWKVSVDGGFHCPNADGTISHAGCLFCNILSFSPSRRRSGLTIREQLLQAATHLRERRGIQKIIAYFQPGTNTYGPPDKLERLYREALSVPDVVGLAIGTRPDCLSEEVVKLLATLSQETWLTVEIGVQSSHNATLRRINRDHSWEDAVNAIQRCANEGIRVTVHLMFGLPGETYQQMLETAEKVAELPIHGVKIHNLYVAKDTGLAKLYEAGQYEPLSQDVYVNMVCDALERLPPHIVIERLPAETDPGYLIAPDWCRRKGETISLIGKQLELRNTYQGCRFSEGPTQPDGLSSSPNKCGST